MDGKNIFAPPEIMEFKKIGLSEIGYISISENLINIPFNIKRVFWTYYTPESVVRGRHAHNKTEQVIIAAAGRIIVNTEFNNEKKIFVLDTPNNGLYIPPFCWHTMQYSHNAVQIVLASTLYEEKDYYRDYEEFKSLA